MKEFDKIVEKSEKVMWEGKPIFLIYFFAKIVPAFIVFLFASAISLFIVLNKTSAEKSLLTNLFVGVFCAIMFLVVVGTIISYFKLHYAITNKRVIIQKGIIGTDFLIVDFDQITNAEVNVGLLDKMFMKNTGTISIFTPTSMVHTKHGTKIVPHMMLGITDPYKVFKFFKKVSHDVKTDIEFPNAYRPKSNKGYRTSYKG